MKKSLPVWAVLLALFAGGCAPKSVEVVQVKPYEAKPAAFKKSGKVYFGHITDKRKTKDRIGAIVDAKETLTTLRSDVDFAGWFRHAVIDALKKEGCTILTKRVYDPQIPRVYLHIDKIDARYDKSKLTGENLETQVYVTLLVFHGKDSKIVKKIGLTERKWIPPVGVTKAIESALQETLQSVADMVVAHLDDYRF